MQSDNLVDARWHMKLLITFGGNSDLVQRLVDSKVEFLVVGGLAVVFHKCRDPQNVDDLDLLLNPSVENADRFRGLLSSPDLKKLYNLEELYPLPSVSQLASPNFHMPLKLDPMFCIDFFTPTQDEHFRGLYNRSESALLNGRIPVRVISRLDLAERKRKDVRTFSEDRQKHKDDLRCLEAMKRR